MKRPDGRPQTADKPLAFAFDVQAVRLDAGYATSGIANGLEQRKIPGVTGYRNPTLPRPGMMRKSRFAYDSEQGGYVCPQGQLLTCATIDRNGYRHYLTRIACPCLLAAAAQTLKKIALALTQAPKPGLA